MFREASTFNGNISIWDTSQVTDFSSMFRSASSFNQPLFWELSKVKKIGMSEMFRAASTFNGNINAWNTTQVTNFNGMFREAKNFNQDIGGWDTSNVISMAWMFYDASVFQQNISTWDSSKVRSFKKMFGLATAFRLKWECEIAGPPSSCITLRSDWTAPPSSP